MSKPKKRAGSSVSRQKLEAPRTEAAAGDLAANEEVAEKGSVDRIRDIIFGNQMQDYEHRFTRLEERMLQEFRELREEISARLDSIETYIKKEVESLSDRIKAEQEMRAEAVKIVTSEHHTAAKTTSKSIDRLVEKQSKDVSDLRQQLLDQSKGLSGETHKKFKEVSNALDQAVKELRLGKVDRTVLSELLMEMAVRMSNELAEKLKLTADNLSNG
ncbi:MAG: hypothetical protein HKO68_20685 [Desulfobacterales bacterium]|nr:hypothetical protein [Desulfobacterales bacterium]